MNTSREGGDDGGEVGEDLCGGVVLGSLKLALQLLRHNCEKGEKG